MNFMTYLVAAGLILASSTYAQFEGQTILRTIRESEDHLIFSRLLPFTQPKLDRRLGDISKKSTVFAPTDDAFYQLINALTGTTPDNPDDAVNALTPLLNLLNNAAADFPGLVPSTSDMLHYHMLYGMRNLRGLEGKYVKTSAKLNLKLGYFDSKLVDLDLDNENVTVPDAASNLRHSNGLLNIIPAVLLPAPAATIKDRLKEGPSPPATATRQVVPSPTTVPTPSVGMSSAAIPGTSPTDGSDVTPSMNASPTMSPGESTDGGDEGVDGVEHESMEPSTSPDGSSDIGGDGPGGDDDDGVCFPASARVHLPDGSKVRMDELEAGQNVLHSEKESSQIFLFTHRTSAKRARFVRISTSCGHSLTLTPSHYVRSADGALISASHVQAGHTKVRTVSGICDVVKTETISGVGLYAPHSMHGDLVVDGVVVSGYSKAIHPRFAHALLAPVRWFVRSFNAVEPLGKTFYNGADWTLRLLPRGQSVINSV